MREPKTFDASDASTVSGSVTVEFKKRPFGVLAYASWHDRTENAEHSEESQLVNFEFRIQMAQQMD